MTLANPYRIAVDLPDAILPVGEAPAIPRGTAAAGFHFGRRAAEVTRLVIDLNGPVGVKNAFFLVPETGSGRTPANHRLVIDLEPVTEDVFMASVAKGSDPAPAKSAAADTAAGNGEPLGQPLDAAPNATPSDGAAAKPAGKSAAAKTGTEKPGGRKSAAATPVEQPITIVIDAGHGGIDPGAIGADGSYEKDITLAAARELKRQLDSTGRYKAILTRDGDTFLPLRERVAVARKAGASLFVSMHADTHAHPETRGLSVYTLSERASDREAEMLAAKENKADLIAGVDLGAESRDVTNILIDLAQRETMNLSARFAAMAISALRKEVPLLKDTHRFAGFAVLKAPDVPSVLVELGYLSNKTDLKHLDDPAYRAKLAWALMRSIDAYFDWKIGFSRS